VSLAATTSTAPVFPNVLASPPAGTGGIQFFSSNFGSPMIHQADLIFEREVLRDTTVSVSYLLSIGRKLPTFYDRNLSPPTLTQTYTLVGGPFAGQTLTVPAFRGARPNANYAQMTEIASRVKSEYNALVLQANRRFAGGLQLQASYTLSKATDTLQTSTTFTASNIPYNVFDPGGDGGRSNFDRRHKFVASAVYAPRVEVKNTAIRTVADGWSIAPIFQYYTGQPLDAGVSGSLPNANPINPAIPNAISSGINGSGGANRLILVPRNDFSGPDVWNVDLRLSKRFYIKEKFNVEFLGEAFNLFNRTQITGLNSSYYSVGGTAQSATLTFQPAFGTANEAGGTLYRERQVQIGLRLKF